MFLECRSLKEVDEILLNGRFNTFSCIGVSDDKNNGYYVEFCGVGYDKHNGYFSKFDKMYGSRKRYSCMFKYVKKFLIDIDIQI